MFKISLYVDFTTVDRPGRRRINTRLPITTTLSCCGRISAGRLAGIAHPRDDQQHTQFQQYAGDMQQNAATHDTGTVPHEQLQQYADEIQHNAVTHHIDTVPYEQLQQYAGDIQKYAVTHGTGTRVQLYDNTHIGSRLNQRKVTFNFIPNGYVTVPDIILALQEYCNS